jgi:virginiamycin B lyase
MDFTRTGDIWFTAQQGNQIGFLDTKARKITLHDLATPNARPYGLIVGKDDQPWVVLFGTNKLATIQDDKVVEIPLPRPETRPRRLAVTADGTVWYVDYAAGYLGRYNPGDGSVEEWRAPSGERSRPYAMTSDKNGNLWLVETGVQPNRLVGFDAEHEIFISSTEIKSGGGAVRHMVYDPDSHSIWFGTDTNTIGRARLP